MHGQYRPRVRVSAGRWRVDASLRPGHAVAAAAASAAAAAAASTPPRAMPKPDSQGTPRSSEKGGTLVGRLDGIREHARDDESECEASDEDADRDGLRLLRVAVHLHELLAHG